MVNFTKFVLVQEENWYQEPYCQESFNLFNGVHIGSSAKKTGGGAGDSRANEAISNGGSSVGNTNSNSNRQQRIVEVSDERNDMISDGGSNVGDTNITSGDSSMSDSGKWLKQ